MAYRDGVMLYVTCCVQCAYSAVRDPLLMAVLLHSPELLSQLAAVDVGVQLRYWAQHNHLKQLCAHVFIINWHVISIALTSSSFIQVEHKVVTSDCTHRHLHLELILVELEEDVRERALQEGGRPQNQNQLEVPWEGALTGESRWGPSQQGRQHPPPTWPPLHITLERDMFCSSLPIYHPLPLCASCENSGSNTLRQSTGKWKHVGDGGALSCGRDINLHVLWDSLEWIMR